ncbi:MAG: DUF2164 domain-containing protein [Gammaproteobacteria bacterium]|jgi:uncharacterized protein (DUF2164 family)|nr:DUF2164 domain-containing protein [Gammaproteobacteria bacterium]
MIEFSKQNKEAIIEKLKVYFQNELHQEIGGFDAEFLLDFFIKEIGGFFYNQALADVHALLEKQMENLVDTIYALEQPVSPRK